MLIILYLCNITIEFLLSSAASKPLAVASSSNFSGAESISGRCCSLL
jgi:hypothetical protein